MPGFLERATDAIRRRLRMKTPFVPVTVLGRELAIARGTRREGTDYDDAWFLACALRAEVIFDVGANQGDMALLALLCPGLRELVLIEPNPEALLLAAENIVRNRMSTRVRFVCAFVSDVGGSTARLWTVGSGAAGSMYAGHAVTASRAGRSMEVPTVTLDDLADTYGLVPDLVKVDVEGAEALVLAAARRTALKPTHAIPGRDALEPGAVDGAERHSRPGLVRRGGIRRVVSRERGSSSLARRRRRPRPMSLAAAAVRLALSPLAGRHSAVGASGDGAQSRPVVRKAARALAVSE